MLDIRTIKVSMPLKKKFVVSKGEATAKTNLIAILNNRYGGEAASSVHYGPSLPEIEADLHKGIAKIKRKRKFDRKALQQINKYDIHPIARSALMAMVLNYISGESERYPWEILELGAPVGIRSSTTIGIDDPGSVIDAIKESEYSIVKLKMGGEFDAELIQRLNEISGKEIRVDANGGWSSEKAEEMIFYLAKLGVVVIEQPTDLEHVADWQLLKGKNEDVELILDEGLCTVADYNEHAEHIDGVNIKMEKSGGILEAVRVAKKARKEKKKVMLGCMVESSLGIAQSVYMSSLADYHDLDAPLLLETDIAQGITYDKDSIHVDREIIGGPSLKRDLVEKYISE
ncbi:MAG: hypothetical protein GY867_02875 [bacterium]|nr:hypothetical protein [bacterium]